MPYAIDTIEFFKNKNLKLACATGSPRNEAMLKLEKTGLKKYFHQIISGSDVKAGKPHPDIYEFACKQIGLEPSECLAFEDTQYGVESAKSAGLVCFAIPNEFSKDQDFSKADGVFKNLNEAVASIH